jgi:hypothetical protein
VKDGYAYIVAGQRDENLLYIVDVSDPEHPVYVDTFTHDPKHVTDIIISGKYLYLGVYWGNFRLFDISQPLTPTYVLEAMPLVSEGWDSAWALGRLWGEHLVIPTLSHLCVVDVPRDQQGLTGPITVEATINATPALGTVSPVSGTGPVSVTTHFTTTWTDPDGWEDLKQCYFHIGDGPTLPGNVTLMYNSAKDKLWLWDDVAGQWTGGDAPESANTIENGQATVYCALTTATGSGDTLTVKWAVEFRAGFEGEKRLGLKCKDRHKARAKGAWKGDWTVTAS